VLVVAGNDPHAWQEPLLRLIDTAIGTAVALVAARLFVALLAPAGGWRADPAARTLGTPGPARARESPGRDCADPRVIVRRTLHRTLRRRPQADHID
jgi:hypothetical protein